MSNCTDLLLPTLLVTSSLLTAQRTWVVDGGGGGDFHTVQAAVDRANAGDTVFVQAWTSPYAGATTARGVQLLGRGRPQVQGLTVRDMPATQTFVAKGLDLTAPVELLRNKGRVHFEAVDIHRAFFARPMRGLTIERCAQVTLTHSTLGATTPPLRVDRSTVYLAQVSATAQSASFGPFASEAFPALDTTGSHVVIAGGRFQGGNGAYDFTQGPRAPRPGIVMTGGDVTIAGDGTRVAAGATTFFGPISAPAIAASAGQLTIAPTVVLVPTRDVPVRGVSPTIIALPTLDGQGGAPGTRILIDAFGVVGSTSMLWVSLPGPRIPFVFGDVWLDLSIAFPLTTATVPAGGHLRTAIPVGNMIFPGTPLAFQALQIDGSRVTLSTPLTVAVH